MSKSLETRVETLRNAAKIEAAALEQKGEANITAEDRVKLQNILSEGAKAVADLEAWHRLTKKDDLGEPKGKTDDGPPSRKSFGERFTASDAFKNRRNSKSFGADIEVKANELVGISSVGGVVTYPVQAQRLPDIEFIAQRGLELLNLIPRGPTANTNALTYVRQNTHTNNAAETDEYATKPQNVYDFEEVTEPIRTIAATHFDSEQVLDDEPRLQSIIEGLLTNDVLQRAQSQAVAGSGASPNLRGWLNTSGTTNRVFQTSGRNFAAGETRAEAIRKMLTDIRISNYMPSVVIMNPEDAEQMELEEYTANKFIRATDIATGRVWRIPLVESSAMTSGTVLAMDIQAATKLYVRDDVRVEVDRINDQFIKNAITIRAEMRAALLTPQPGAIAKMTGA